MEGKSIRIIKKNDEYSMEYQIGDIFSVDSTWYGGANVTSKSGIPLSLDQDEYEIFERDQEAGIDSYSYGLGVMDCFCEMVASGLKTLAMSHPVDSATERNAWQKDVARLCASYDIKFYKEDEPLLTALFPEELNRGKYNYLFYRTDDVLDQYLKLKERQKVLMESGSYTGENSLELAREFGRLLSYPDEGIDRLIQKAGKEQQAGR